MYDLNHFLNKFRLIPDDKWCSDNLSTKDGARCALGHCNLNQEGPGLVSLFMAGSMYPTTVNDGKDPRFKQTTPKARILAALESLAG